MEPMERLRWGGRSLRRVTQVRCALYEAVPASAAWLTPCLYEHLSANMLPNMKITKKMTPYAYIVQYTYTHKY